MGDEKEAPQKWKTRRRKLICKATLQHSPGASLALQEAISTPWSVLLPYFWLPRTDLGAYQTG